MVRSFVFIANLTQSLGNKKNLNEGFPVSVWLMSVSVGDCLGYVNRCGKHQSTVGGTIPWVWVLDYV